MEWYVDEDNHDAGNKYYDWDRGRGMIQYKDVEYQLRRQDGR